MKHMVESSDVKIRQLAESFQYSGRAALTDGYLAHTE